ncbi:hypothetical protein N39L_40040 [Limnospira platensis NIES-39]|uniref:Uncharacterized protein n=1 Tax=Limnospira platensis NIES-46 TaxID=1236695 RepID=A0A5M3T2J8_LIMPL|nr:hypothetical protein N39L_40040 [Arthrospira platensis NIES-39]GCE92090.1 hypothetical protein NIES46_01250 [Arthrospira platensis NIES-46]
MTTSESTNSYLEAPQPSNCSIHNSSETFSNIMQKLMNYADRSITVLFSILRQVEENLG